MVAASEMLERLINDSAYLDLKANDGQFAGAREELAVLVENLARVRDYKVAKANAREEAVMSAEALVSEGADGHRAAAAHAAGTGRTCCFAAAEGYSFALLETKSKARAVGRSHRRQR